MGIDDVIAGGEKRRERKKGWGDGGEGGGELKRRGRKEDKPPTRALESIWSIILITKEPSLWPETLQPQYGFTDLPRSLSFTLTVYSHHGGDVQCVVGDRRPFDRCGDKSVCDECCGSAVFVLEDSGWNGGLHLVGGFSAPLRKAGRSASLPREPSGGRKRQDSGSWRWSTCVFTSQSTASVEPVSLIVLRMSKCVCHTAFVIGCRTGLRHVYTLFFTPWKESLS